jgi:hypothetical protein
LSSTGTDTTGNSAIGILGEFNKSSKFGSASGFGVTSSTTGWAAAVSVCGASAGGGGGGGASIGVGGGADASGAGAGVGAISVCTSCVTDSTGTSDLVSVCGITAGCDCAAGFVTGLGGCVTGVGGCVTGVLETVVITGFDAGAAGTAAVGTGAAGAAGADTPGFGVAVGNCFRDLLLNRLNISVTPDAALDFLGALDVSAITLTNSKADLTWH